MLHVFLTFRFSASVTIKKNYDIRIDKSRDVNLRPQPFAELHAVFSWLSAAATQFAPQHFPMIKKPFTELHAVDRH